MAKQITNQINSGFNPTHFIGGIPLYALGGRFKSWLKNKALPGFKSGLEDYGKFMVDNTLSAVGAKDVIGEDDYNTGMFKAVSPVANQIYQQTLPMAMNAVAPGSVQIMSGVQQGIGQATNMPGSQNASMTQTQAPIIPTFAYGGLAPNLQNELQAGQKVEMEHKPTLDYIKKYYKENGKFPTAKKMAKSIAVDHLKDFKNINKAGNATEETYYKGLVGNNLSDELLLYAMGGPLSISNNSLENIRQMRSGGFLSSYPDGGSIPTNNVGNNIAAGGLHEQNPNGGIPVGNNALVEQDEYVFNHPTKGKYVFTNKF